MYILRIICGHNKDLIAERAQLFSAINAANSALIHRTVGSILSLIASEGAWSGSSLM